MSEIKTKILLCRNFMRLFVPLFLFCALANTNSVAQVFWQQTNGPYGGFINALATNSNGQIFAGTFGGGVFRSMDDGNSWAPINTGLENSFVRSLTINSSGHIFVGTSQGVFRSMNNGNSWDNVNTAALENLDVLSLAINTSGGVFAGTVDGVFRSMNNGRTWEQINTGLLDLIVYVLAINSSGHIFAGTRGGVFRSTDNGARWQTVNTGLTSAVVFSLAINSSGHIFAGTEDGGVFRSTNDGSSWMAINAGLTDLDVLSLGLNVSGHIFAGTGGGLFRSTNNGSSWMPVNTGLMNFRVSSFAFNASGHIFAGTSGGVFRSTDNGSNWTAVNTGLTDLEVFSLAINTNGNIFAATDVGVFRSMNNDNSWTAVNDGLTNSDVRSLAINTSGEIFAGTTGGGVFHSPNNGDIWRPVNTDLTSTVILSLAINSNGYIFAGTGDGGGIFRSMNKGNSWTPVNSGLTTNTNIRSLVINSSGHIFAGSDRGVFRSTNNGDSWTAVNTGLTNTIVEALATSVIGHIFAGTSGGGVFRSTNNGTSWAAINIGLTATFVRALAINSNGHIFAGTSEGVFRSENNGDNWTPVNAGLTNPAVRSLAINLGGFVFAGMVGSGVFRSVKSTILLNLNTTVNFPSHPRASDYKDTDYSIVGLPGASNLPINEFLPGIHRQDWQVYWDNGAADSFFVEFDGGSEFLFSVGRAFWIIHKGPVVINTTATFPLLNASLEAEIQLHPSWNLIANPFLSSVTWSQVKAHNVGLTKPLWEYQGTAGFAQTNTLKPYVGYYFDNSDNLDSLKIPFVSSSAPSSLGEIDPVIWRINIALFSGEFRDGATSFGSSSDARPSLDYLDYRKPRAIAAIPSVYFQRPEWDTAYSIFATDIRPEFEDTETWEFDAFSPQPQPATLTFSGIESVPIQYEVYLIDDERGYFVNLRVDSVYQFTPKKEITEFRVLVGKAASVEEILSSVLPKEFELGPNYPNPFNPSTNIPVAVPFDSEITLKVYNIRGQEVRTIYSGQMEAGRHLVEWDGKDARGKTIASGVYIYRLTTSSKVALTGKMLLMK